VTVGHDVTVEIDALATGGDAVGRQRDDPSAPTPDDGRVTFVALAAPGERVRARLVREKGRVAWAELQAVERAGPARVVPPCPLFGACGGCQWQHVSLESQRAAKQAIVERACGVPLEGGAVVAASPPFGYRDRAQLTVGKGGQLGFHGRRSHDVVDVPACPLLSPALARALPALRALAKELPAGAEVDVQAGAEGVHVHVSVRRGEGLSAARATEGEGAHLDASAPRGEAATAASAAGGADEQRLRAAGVVGFSVSGRAAGRSAWGARAVDVSEPGGPPLPVPAGAFAQVGRAANAALVRAALAAVGPDPGVVLELYAGSGNFTRHLARIARQLHAADADSAAVARGRAIVPGAAWSVRPPAALTPDTVLLDPPREGADGLHLEAARRARRRVVYVSCDPQTLARDAQRLRAAGFTLTRATALDLMPQTFHVEVVAIFDRAPASDAP
jgi:23S rRNA (uracil1939-C5)-methyltransferase